MKKCILFLILFPVLILQSQQKVETDDFIISIDKIEQALGKPFIRWVKEDEKNKYDKIPVFNLKDNSSELSAKGWISMTDKYLYLKVEVTDDVNFNDFEQGTIWKGDGLQIAIDAQGQGAGNAPVESRGMVGNDDCAFGVSLTSKAAIGYAWFWADPKYRGTMPKEMLSIQRNEKKKLTVYEISIPWEKLHNKPGLYPEFGIAVQINDSDPKQSDQKHLYWGKGADGEPRPGLFEKMLIGNSVNEFYASEIVNSTIWTKDQPAEMIFAVASGKNMELVSICNDKTIVEPINPKEKHSISRLSVKLHQKSLKQPLSMSATFINKNENKEQAKQNLQVTLPNIMINGLINQLDFLMGKPENHPLFQWHLLSSKTIAMDEWAKTNLYGITNNKLRDESYKFLSSIESGFKGDAAIWENYLTGQRSLLMAYTSKVDASIQYYLLGLPKDWDINKAYPLYFELHGSANPHPLAFITEQIGDFTMNEKMNGNKTHEFYARQLRDGYHVYPWGRGNNGYRDIGETDIWEVYKDVSSRFKIDEDHRYLFGFSMGGGGTWSIGTRTPNVWAAIGVFAGATRRESTCPVTLSKNISYLPVFIEVGDKDFLYPEFELMKAELEANNQIHFSKVYPNMEHQYPDSVQKTGIDWMKQFTRKRPDKFFFAADNSLHTGAWGITMIRNEKVSPTPEFTCKIENQTVKIDSKGTLGLSVDLGEKGLKMSGSITLIWNGEKVYEGEPKIVKLGQEMNVRR